MIAAKTRPPETFKGIFTRQADRQTPRTNVCLERITSKAFQQTTVCFQQPHGTAVGRPCLAGSTSRYLSGKLVSHSLFSGFAYLTPSTAGRRNGRRVVERRSALQVGEGQRTTEHAARLLVILAYTLFGSHARPRGWKGAKCTSAFSASGSHWAMVI